MNTDRYARVVDYRPCSETDELKIARGKRFVKLLRTVYEKDSGALAVMASGIVDTTGKLTVVDVAQLAIQFNLQLKHAFDFLEERRVLPTATYEKVKASKGFRVSDAMKEAERILRAHKPYKHPHSEANTI